MAVSTPNGLIVVVIPSADQLSLTELNDMINARADRARYGKIKLSDIEGGTFTVSNLGMYGIDSGFSIPRPPESAILLIGALRPRPVVVDGKLTVRDTCWISLTFDHRFIEGAVSAEFLKDIDDACNHLEKLRV
jgi:pyruvate/2-oxoglutarate dehydrogenase complex dihydrolipoamide acyltransferase (E2) component